MLAVPELAAVGGGFVVDTRNDIANVSIPSWANAISTGGYAQPGDFGAGVYKRVGFAPAHALYVESDNGAFFQLSVPTIQFEQAGGASTNTAAQNDTAMRTILVYAGIVGGVKIAFAGSNYNFSLATSWALPANTGFVGQGITQTTLTRTDSSAVNWLTMTNTSGGFVSDGIKWVGNNQATVNGNGCLLFAQVTEGVSGIADATQDMRNISFVNSAATNFKGDGWFFGIIYGRCAFNIDGITATNNEFTTNGLNCRGPADLSKPAGVFYLQGYTETLAPVVGTAGRIKNVNINANYFNIPGTKSAVLILNGCDQINVKYNYVPYSGTNAAILDNCGAYCMAWVNEIVGAPSPDNVYFYQNIILNPHSCGFYGAAWGSPGGTITVDGAYVSNVTDTVDGTLPKAAWAQTDKGNTLIVKNLWAVNCRKTISSIVEVGQSVYLDNIVSRNGPANQPAIYMVGVTSGGQTGTISIGSYDLQSSAAGSMGLLFPTKDANGVVCNYGTVNLFGTQKVRCVSNCAMIYDYYGAGTSNAFSVGLNWSGCIDFLSTTGNGIVLYKNQSLIQLCVSGTIRRGAGAGVAPPRINAEECTNIQYQCRISIDSQGTNGGDGVAVNNAGAKGNIALGAIAFSNCHPSYLGAGLGFSQPTYIPSGAQGQYIANLSPGVIAGTFPLTITTTSSPNVAGDVYTSTGTAAYEYSILAWEYIYSISTWKEHRTITSTFVP